MIRIVPAIDLIGGRCVRLTRGDYATKKVYDASPVETARRYADCGVQRIHLVDLDGAKASRPCNLSVLEQIAAAVPCELEWGGGIATTDDVERVFSAGATHAIIGSVAALQPERFEEWLSRWGSRMVLGADVRQTEGRPVPSKDLSSLSEDLPVPPSSQGSRGYAPQGGPEGPQRSTETVETSTAAEATKAAGAAGLEGWRVAVKGWQEEAPLSLDAILRRFAGRELREAIVTDIGRDGMLQGPTTGLYVQLQAAFPQVTFTVSGGVSSMDDIRALDAAGLQKAIVGKALYENRITLKDIALWSQKESYPASM